MLHGACKLSESLAVTVPLRRLGRACARPRIGLDCPVTPVVHHAPWIAWIHTISRETIVVFQAHRLRKGKTNSAGNASGKTSPVYSLIAQSKLPQQFSPWRC